jgi:predicted alpha/beta hydrolase family esterase
MKSKIDVLYIHGGTTFATNKDYLKYLQTKKVSLGKRVGWYGDNLQKSLGNKFLLTTPRMPLQDNARYRDWELMFENYMRLIKGPYMLIGVSLGGIFLAKYLSENKLPQKALSVYLVCPPFDDTVSGERLLGGFKLKNDLSLIQKNSENVYLMFSQDDDVVPVAHAEKYRKKLPSSNIIIYTSKNGHFVIEHFPEIVKSIKADIG